MKTSPLNIRSQQYGIDLTPQIPTDPMAQNIGIKTSVEPKTIVDQNMTGANTIFDGPLEQEKTFSSGMMMKSPLKELSSEALVSPFKMDDLSGDGKITQKDVLIGKGVIDKEGNKIKQ